MAMPPSKRNEPDDVPETVETDPQHENPDLATGTEEAEKVKDGLETAKRTTGEEPVDYMPKEKPRPYGDAITDAHREFLSGLGHEVPPKSE